MAWHHRFWNVLRSNRLQSDLERELRFHVTERIEELQESGLSRHEAERVAQLHFGGLTRHIERTRDMDINALLDSTLRNFKYAVRSLSKTPAFTITVLLTLALGIGANSAVFSAIDAVLLRPLPFPDGNRLMQLYQTRAGSPQEHLVAPSRVEDWNRLNHTFMAVAAFYTEDTSETSGELPEKLQRAWVTPRFLQVLGVAPALGRDFNSAEEHFGGPNAAWISDRLWHRRFGANPGVIGKRLRVATRGIQTVQIVGVMPSSFQFPSADVDLWSPSPPDAPYAQNREETWYTVIGRLKPGVTLSQARADLAAVQSNLGRQFPKPDAELSVTVEPLKEMTVGAVRKSLWLLFASVTLLLLIACTNIAALLLSRAAARRQEISVRFSLGASRSSVIAQLLTEVLTLAVGGAVLGLFFAAGASQVFRSLAKDLPRIDEIRLNGSIVAYSLACAVAVTLLCGLLPAIRGTRRDLAVSLAHGGRSQVSGRNPLQFAMVGVQVALAVTLLAGAGLLLRSFEELGRVSAGFDPGSVLTFHVSTTWAETNGFKGAKQRLQRILDGMRTLPGVESAAAADSLPGVPSKYAIEIKTTEGRADSEPRMMAESRWVTPEYFDTMRIPLVEGQPCRDEASATSAVVNRTLANLYLNGSAAIGRHLLQPAAEIRGIVGDARETGLEREPPPVAYWCNAVMQPGTFFLVRTKGDPMSLAQAVRRKLHELEPQRSVFDLTPLTDHISDAYAENRLRTVLLAFFAITAIGLASVGLYGTLSYLVNIRRREVALRMALGALRTQVVQQFLGQGLLVAALGCVGGLALAAGFGRMLSGMLYGVSATDAITLGGVVAIVLAVSTLASLLPAVRAARLEPMQALREE